MYPVPEKPAVDVPTVTPFKVPFSASTIAPFDTSTTIIGTAGVGVTVMASMKYQPQSLLRSKVLDPEVKANEPTGEEAPVR